MAEGDVWEIVDVQEYRGQEILNVYFYEQNAVVLVGDQAQQVADAFEANVLPAILDIQTTDILHTELRVRNLFDPGLNTISLISENGGLGGTDTQATFDAVGFRLKQDNGAIRNGSKRYSGISSAMDTDGVITEAGIITNLLALGAALALGLDIGIVANAIVPVVVGRILDGGNYRLPANAGEAVIGLITEALYDVNTTSQVSRKVGNGS